MSTVLLLVWRFVSVLSLARGLTHVHPSSCSTSFRYVLLLLPCGSCVPFPLFFYASRGLVPRKNRHFDVLSKECQEHRERLRGVIQGLADQVPAAWLDACLCAIVCTCVPACIEPACLLVVYSGPLIRNALFRLQLQYLSCAPIPTAFLVFSFLHVLPGILLLDCACLLFRRLLSVWSN